VATASSSRMNAGSDIERLEVDVSVGIESERAVMCEDDKRMGGGETRRRINLLLVDYERRER